LKKEKVRGRGGEEVKGRLGEKNITKNQIIFKYFINR